MQEVTKTNKNIENPVLFSAVCTLIDGVRYRIATAANVEICITHWQIGKRIKEDVLFNQRAEYGKQVLKNLSVQLTEKYGNGWSFKKLQHCLRSAYTFSEEEIVSALRRQLNWTHLRTIMYIDDELKRSFYLEMCKIENWTTRMLSERIDSMLYERTAISAKSEEVIKQELEKLKTNNQISPDLIFRSSYFLDMLGLASVYSEKDLEDAIVVQLQEFIIELGSDFAFMARQKLIMVDGEDYHLDLLFFHRRLKCLVAIDLKLGKFKSKHKGQMELYLSWLEKNMMLEGENPPVGLILCSEGNTEHIEYLMLNESNVKVAQYFTQLPDKKLLSEKLHKAIAIAKENFEKNKNVI